MASSRPDAIGSGWFALLARRRGNRHWLGIFIWVRAPSLQHVQCGLILATLCLPSMVSYAAIQACLVRNTNDDFRCRLPHNQIKEWWEFLIFPYTT